MKKDSAYYEKLNDSLFTKLKNTYNEKECLFIMNEIATSNQGLVQSIARKFENLGDKDECFAIANFGLAKAIRTFDITKKIKFATYATIVIENELLMFNRRNKKNKCVTSIYEVLTNGRTTDEFERIDVLQAVDDTEESVITKILIPQILEELTAREKTIILMRYGLNDNDPKTQKEVATALGISQSYVARLEQRILKKMKEKINRDPVIIEITMDKEKEEENRNKELLNKIRKEKDQDKLNQLKWELVEINLNLLDEALERLHIFTQNTLYTTIGIDGIMSAINSYDIGSNMTFKNYTKGLIAEQIKKHIDREDKQIKHVEYINS